MIYDLSLVHLLLPFLRYSNCHKDAQTQSLTLVHQQFVPLWQKKMSDSIMRINRRL